MSSKLGKRKERGEDVSAGTHYGSTLFISNLPYSATSVDLQTLFSDIAPVKSAFVVTEHGTGISKGVGYVSFAIKEDAETAFEAISKEGISLAGRQLGVQWAESKPKRKGEKDAVKTESKPKPIPRLPHDPLAIRTIILSGIPSGIDSKVLWKKIRKYEGAEKVDWPVNDESRGEDSSTAHVLFSTAGQASDAVSKLHAHVYKGSLLSVTLKKRLDTLAKPSTKARKAPAPSYASRLIVRNIPFDATGQDLRAVFLPYGPIHSIHIPTDDKPADPKEDDDTTSNRAESSTAAAYAAEKKPRTKGFAFVWMLSKKDAERALQGCNGTVMRSGMAETLALDKQKKKKLKRLEQKRAKAAAGIKVEEGHDGEGQDTEEEDGASEKRATERIIAVDWALSKDKWKEEKKKLDDDERMEGLSGSDNDSDDSEDEGLGFHSESESRSDSEDEDKVKPELPPPEAGTTLFVRNVPFNATEEELRIIFRAFGPLRYVRITVDPATGRSRGTGFACFWNLADADRAVEQSELLRAETTGQGTAPKKNPFSLPSILTPDPSSSLAQSLVLRGRTLDVVRAVTRDTASKLKDANEKLREKADKRNMYLLHEGVIMPNTPAAENLTPAEVEKRTSSFNAQRMLKRLAGHTMKAFNADVKEGTREPLTADELADQPTALPGEDVTMTNVKQEDDDAEKEKKGKKKKFTGRDTGVKQTKIVRQAERVDPITGKGKSKGYGFMEMHKHSDALRVLRWANNNPQVGELFGLWWKDELENILKSERAKEEKDRDDARIKKLKEEIEREVNGESRGKKIKGTLIVEFSIENIQVVQRRNALQEKSKTTSSAPTDSPDKRTRKDSDGDDSKKGSDGRPTKKPRLSADIEIKPGPKTEERSFNPLGSIIGRKRKERKAGKK
ncbi:hypothetical protein NLJ89_g1208 [Agrocybe chaxingu]|uniref:RRM domain-containing protein n=1 Tax=Agrocybe chaxingu TaxID=84603 RepID=A0A9W8N0F3_9AGAR|nr:hypothetical protein NLJ89_g1208 [Agrocybe chaxingu]